MNEARLAENQVSDFSLSGDSVNIKMEEMMLYQFRAVSSLSTDRSTFCKDELPSYIALTWVTFCNKWTAQQFHSREDMELQ